jgi:hypothetical protein
LGRLALLCRLALAGRGFLAGGGGGGHGLRRFLDMFGTGGAGHGSMLLAGAPCAPTPAAAKYGTAPHPRPAPTNGGQALLVGTIDWNKNAQAASTRLYKSGFLLHQLTAVGGKYTKPAVGQFVLGLLNNAGGNNAKFVFSDGGLTGPAPIAAAAGAADLNKAFRIAPTTAASTAAIKLSAGGANPDLLTLSLSTSTGAFSGGFVLKDAPDASKPTVKVSRSASFYGVLVPRVGLQQGVGFFVLGELPAAGLPATALTTTAQLSGQVLIESGP